MNLNALRLGMSFNLMMRTMPILLVRLGVMLVFWVVALIYLAITFAVAYLVGQAVPFIGVILFIVALVAVGPIYNLAYRYIFYTIKTAHIAVIAELLTKDRLPDGVNQLSYGKQRVEERFGEVNAMFVVDELVNGVIHAFTNTVYSVTSWLPGETLDTLVRIVNRVIRFAMNYIDEAVMARSFYRTEGNVWENARDGVVLYAQVWKPILVNAIALMLLSYVPFIAALVLFALPVGLLLNLISPQLAGWSIIFLLILAYMVKVAVGDAFAMTAIIAAYQRETTTLTPNPEMAAQLDSLSDQFRELTQRARDGIAGLGRPSPTNGAPASPAAPANPPPPNNSDVSI
jgi:hypothetical protein